MATKRQRRRREKDRRHEYEIVYVDDTGEEVEVEETEKEPKPRKTEAKKPDAKGGASAGREVQPPSWNRVIRRGAFIAPFILLFVYFTSSNKSSYSFLVAAIPLIVLLPVMMYVTDGIIYRSYQKRLAKNSGSKPKSK